MDFTPIIANLPLYLEGLATTVWLVVAALVIGLVLSHPIAIAAGARRRWISAWPLAFIHFFRGTPLLIQIFLVYYGLAQFEWVRESALWPIFKEAKWCALIAFSLNTAAYTAKILSGAIAQTSFTEIEAARAAGMSPGMVLRRIVLPSAWRRALPTWGNEVVFMLHGSALAGVITIVDLFGAARIVNSRHFIPFESFLTAGAFYLALTFLIVKAFKVWEKRWHRHLRGHRI